MQQKIQQISHITYMFTFRYAFNLTKIYARFCRAPFINPAVRPITASMESRPKGLFRPDASASKCRRKTQRAGFGTHVSQSEHSDRPRRIKKFIQ